MGESNIWVFQGMRSDGLNNKGATQYRKVNQGLQEEKDRKSLNKYKKEKKKYHLGTIIIKSRY